MKGPSKAGMDGQRDGRVLRLLPGVHPGASLRPPRSQRQPRLSCSKYRDQPRQGNPGLSADEAGANWDEGGEKGTPRWPNPASPTPGGRSTFGLRLVREHPRRVRSEHPKMFSVPQG